MLILTCRFAKKEGTMRIIAIAFLSLLLIACAGSPIQVSRMGAQEIKSVSDKDLLSNLSNRAWRNSTMFTEAQRRGLITGEESRLIQQNKIARGMSERALVISWGKPRRINTSTGSWGTRKQYVYGGFYGKYISTKANYVYVRNGVVDSWQQ